MFKRGSYTLLTLVCLILYIIIFYIIDHTLYLKDWQYICLSDCLTPVCQTITFNLRDQSYWLDPQGHHQLNPIKCKLTMYELSHMMFHIWVGYEYGLWTSLCLSLVFEIYEHFFHDCGSILDLFWNLLGAFIGIVLKYYWSKH